MGERQLVFVVVVVVVVVVVGGVIVAYKANTKGQYDVRERR